MQRTASPREFLRHALLVLVIDTLIAVGMTMAGGDRPFWNQFLYAQCIGLSSWMLIDFGRFAVKRHADSGWPEGWRAVALPAFGVAAGNLIGSALADVLTGRPPLESIIQSPRGLLGHAVHFGLIGGVVAYLFWSTGRARHFAELVADTRRQAAETQLRLLQSQLEPHMLFNTLANLRVLITSDPARAQVMLDHLIAFLRSTLAGTRASEHALATEFERTADYLALMKVRMGDRLCSHLSLPDDLAAVPVPPLLLQPLVENAIKHGLEPHLDGGRLSVRARREGEHLVVDVRDTGVGLDVHGDAGSQFGLLQVRERLQTRYGGRASLTLSTPSDGGGALATVRLPLEPDHEPSHRPHCRGRAAAGREPADRAGRALARAGHRRHRAARSRRD